MKRVGVSPVEDVMQGERDEEAGDQGADHAEGQAFLGVVGSYVQGAHPGFGEEG